MDQTDVYRIDGVHLCILTPSTLCSIQINILVREVQRLDLQAGCLLSWPDYTDTHESSQTKQSLPAAEERPALFLCHTIQIAEANHDTMWLGDTKVRALVVRLGHGTGFEIHQRQGLFRPFLKIHRVLYKLASHGYMLNTAQLVHGPRSLLDVVFLAEIPFLAG